MSLTTHPLLHAPLQRITLSSLFRCRRSICDLERAAPNNSQQHRLFVYECGHDAPPPAVSIKLVLPTDGARQAAADADGQCLLGRRPSDRRTAPAAGAPITGELRRAPPFGKMSDLSRGCCILSISSLWTGMRCSSDDFVSKATWYKTHMCHYTRNCCHCGQVIGF